MSAQYAVNATKFSKIDKILYHYDNTHLESFTHKTKEHFDLN